MSQPDKPTLSLDLRGEHCPYNAIATLETLAT
ncbi:SirA-like protein, partial [Pseudomonas aeruginosa]